MSAATSNTVRFVGNAMIDITAGPLKYPDHRYTEFWPFYAESSPY